MNRKRIFVDQIENENVHQKSEESYVEINTDVSNQNHEANITKYIHSNYQSGYDPKRTISTKLYASKLENRRNNQSTKEKDRNDHSKRNIYNDKNNEDIDLNNFQSTSQLTSQVVIPCNNNIHFQSQNYYRTSSNDQIIYSGQSSNTDKYAVQTSNLISRRCENFGENLEPNNPESFSFLINKTESKKTTNSIFKSIDDLIQSDLETDISISNDQVHSLFTNKLNYANNKRQSRSNDNAEYKCFLETRIKNLFENAGEGFNKYLIVNKCAIKRKVWFDVFLFDFWSNVWNISDNKTSDLEKMRNTLLFTDDIRMMQVNSKNNYVSKLLNHIKYIYASYKYIFSHSVENKISISFYSQKLNHNKEEESPNFLIDLKEYSKKIEMINSNNIKNDDGFINKINTFIRNENMNIEIKQNLLSLFNKINRLIIADLFNNEKKLNITMVLSHIENLYLLDSFKCEYFRNHDYFLKFSALNKHKSILNTEILEFLDENMNVKIKYYPEFFSIRKRLYDRCNVFIRNGRTISKKLELLYLLKKYQQCISFFERIDDNNVSEIFTVQLFGREYILSKILYLFNFYTLYIMQYLCLARLNFIFRICIPSNKIESSTFDTCMFHFFDCLRYYKFTSFLDKFDFLKNPVKCQDKKNWDCIIRTLFMYRKLSKPRDKELDHDSTNLNLC